MSNQTPTPPQPPSAEDQQLLARLTQGIVHRDRSFFDGLTLHEQGTALSILRELRANGRAPSLDLLWEIDYERRPCTIDDFFDDPSYCGKFLHEHLFPEWRHEFNQIIEKHSVEAIFTGAIGVGKTTAAVALNMYLLQRLLCMHDPCGFYASNSIVFALFSVIKSLSDTVEYGMITKLLLESDFFRALSSVNEQDNKRKPQNAIISFPKGIRFAFGSQAVHTLGSDVFSGIMDEVAFGGGGVESKQMKELYNNVRRRIDSRFKDSRGAVPGVLCVCSSANLEGDFLDTHIKEAQTSKNVHLVSYAIWDVKPYEGPRFRVQIGDMVHGSSILDSVNEFGQVTGQLEEPFLDTKIIDVPTVYYEAFSKDIEGSIRDIAGISLFSNTPFIPHRERIRAAVVTDIVHPFTISEPKIHIRSDVELEHIFIKEALFQCSDPFRDVWHIKRHQAAPRFVHIDQAINHCAAGMAISHLAGVREVVRIDAEQKRFVELAPVVEFDLLLRIPATPGSEIDLGKIQSFVFFLIRLGMPIRLVTYDQFQSAGAIQTFTKASIESKRVSVDITPEQYLTLKEAIMEGRARYYEYEPFLKELTMLQRIDAKPSRAIMARRRFKVDHPAGGSKDCSDAAAAACWTCVTSKYSASQIASLRAVDGIESLTTKPPLPANPRLTQPSASWIVKDHDEGDAISRMLDGGL